MKEEKLQASQRITQELKGRIIRFNKFTYLKKGNTQTP